MSTVLPAILPTIISTCIASAVAYGVAFYRARYDERKSIHDMITKMIELSMAYPHVESPTFIKSWPDVPGASEQDLLRYDIYCCYVFNLLERVVMFSRDPHSSEIAVANDILHVPEIISSHRRWWTNESDNQNGYSRDFCKYVDKIIASLEETK